MVDFREQPLQPPLYGIRRTPPTTEAEVVELRRIDIEGVPLPLDVTRASSRSTVGYPRMPDEDDIRHSHGGVAAYVVLLIWCFAFEFNAQRPIGGPLRVLAP